jgi:putative tricarboxylic transport membrane protein
MKKWDRISALVLAILGIAAIYEAVVGIGIGTFAEPGSGFYPFLLAIVLVALAVALFLANLGKNESAQPFWAKGAWRRPILAIAVLAGYLILIVYVGFIVGTVYIFLAWMMIVEKEPFKKSAVVSVSGAALIYLLFVVLMGISFPRGLLV